MSRTPEGSTPDEPTGPLNPRNGDPDLPAPPGGPQRSDAPAGPHTPGGPEVAPSAPDEQPEVHPSSTPDGPQVVPTPAAPQPIPDGPDGEIHARTQAEQLNEELQEENAETSLDQPSGDNT